MDVLNDLYDFYRKYDGIKGYIGSTAKGKLIPYFAVEKTPFPVVIAQYAIHAREYITTYLAMKQIEDFEKRGAVGTVYFIPAVNLDGIEIAALEKPLYKANANGVDLNVNFDAGWGKGKNNLFAPSDANYVGTAPFSESETRALRDFTLFVRADVTLSYHCKGEEIYWNFHQKGKALKRDYALAKHIAAVTGYKIKKTKGSVGGYKDWCIEKIGIPAFTIEVGGDYLTHPVGVENLSEIFEKNKDVIKAVIEKRSIYEKNNGLYA